MTGLGIVAEACRLAAAQDAFTARAAPATARRRAAFDAAYREYRAAQERADAAWRSETVDAQRAFDEVRERWPAGW